MNWSIFATVLLAATAFVGFVTGLIWAFFDIDKGKRPTAGVAIALFSMVLAAVALGIGVEG